jgi:hypothetical protein
MTCSPCAPSLEGGVRQRGDGRCARVGSTRNRSSRSCASRRPERGRGGLSTARDQHDDLLQEWKARYGGIEVSEARRLKALEDENRRLKKLLAEAVLDVAALKDLLAKMYSPPRLARLKMMIEVALHQCIRPLASGLVFQPGRDAIRTTRS